METEFISTHPGITYKIPETENKYARFSSGRFRTKDEQIISYLRQHPDYGVTLTEIEGLRQAVTVGVAICPRCGRVFKTKEALNAHLRTHKGDENDVLSPPEDDSERQ